MCLFSSRVLINFMCKGAICFEIACYQISRTINQVKKTQRFVEKSHKVLSMCFNKSFQLGCKSFCSYFKKLR